jgi:periplasmic protein CpxP/Spy
MKTTTKLILGITTISVLTTSVLGYEMQNKRGCMTDQDRPHKMMKMRHHKKGDSTIGSIMQLNLDQKQLEQITTILEESRKSIEKPSKAFTASEFNKEMFVKLVKQQRDDKIEKRAETIEKIYTLLNTQQKKDLKTLLEAKEIRKGGNQFDKNCNGRR